MLEEHASVSDLSPPPDRWQPLAWIAQRAIARAESLVRRAEIAGPDADALSASRLTLMQRHLQQVRIAVQQARDLATQIESTDAPGEPEPTAERVALEISALENQQHQIALWNLIESRQDEIAGVGASDDHGLTP